MSGKSAGLEARSPSPYKSAAGKAGSRYYQALDFPHVTFAHCKRQFIFPDPEHHIRKRKPPPSNSAATSPAGTTEHPRMVVNFERQPRRSCTRRWELQLLRANGCALGPSSVRRRYAVEWAGDGARHGCYYTAWGGRRRGSGESPVAARATAEGDVLY